MQFLDGGHWDSDPQKCVFGEVYKKVMSCLEEVLGWGTTLLAPDVLRHSQTSFREMSRLTALQ